MNEEIKIPVESVAGFMIGDIYVDVSIEFTPRICPDTKEAMLIAGLNNNLGSLAWEVKNEVKKRVSKYFDKYKEEK